MYPSSRSVTVSSKYCLQHGDNRLGGDDFDQKITDYMIAEFKKQEGVDLSTDKMALQRLKEAAEKAKKELSSATTTNINLPFITATAEGPKHFDMNLTRAKFDELTHDLVEKTAEPVQRRFEQMLVSQLLNLVRYCWLVVLHVSRLYRIK